MKLSKFIILLFFSISALAQNQYPRDYFLFPINPGQRNYLAGNMGEIRPNHFHAGLDVKTGGVEGVPVLAAADGYIHRINVSSHGYGNTLYMSHPNGLRTTYAHLKSFHPKVAEWVRKKQYECENFTVELYPESHLFKFKKGDTIALSGNTGSSGGPHLHFEIRDKNDNVLNPIYFGFEEELKDNTKPDLYRIALETQSINSRISNKLGRIEERIYKIGGKNVINKTIEGWGELGLSISAFDRMDGASNQNGVSRVVVCIDEKECYFFDNESFEFVHNRSMNVHIDYATYKLKGSRFLNCYVEDGNRYSFYKTNQHRGKIVISEERIYKISVDVYDAHGNVSSMYFDIQGKKPSVGKPAFATLGTPQLSYELLKNTLVVKAKNYEFHTALAKVYSGNFYYEIPLSYYEPNVAVYTWDIRKGLPDSIDFCGEKIYFNFKEMVPNRATFNYFDSFMKIYFTKLTLFDTLYLQTDYKETENMEFWQVNDIYTPLYRNAYITLKPQKEYKKDKAHAYSTWSKGSYKYEGGTWEGNQLTFGTVYLGKFTILEDEVPPYVSLHNKSPKHLSFKISDNRSGLKEFKATLNGKWILMEYDHKRNLIWIDSKYPEPIKGEFKLKVTDNANNEKVVTLNL